MEHIPHDFIDIDGDVACAECDCRPGGRWDRGLSCRCRSEIALFSNPMRTIIEKNLTAFSYGYDDEANDVYIDRPTDAEYSPLEVIAYLAGSIARQRVTNSDHIHPICEEEMGLLLEKILHYETMD